MFIPTVAVSGRDSREESGRDFTISIPRVREVSLASEWRVPGKMDASTNGPTRDARLGTRRCCAAKASALKLEADGIRGEEKFFASRDGRITGQEKQKLNRYIAEIDQLDETVWIQPLRHRRGIAFHAARDKVTPVTCRDARQISAMPPQPQPISSTLARLQRQLGRDVALLGFLRGVEIGLRRFEIGAGILPVLVETNS